MRSYSVLEHNRPLVPVETELPDLTGTQVLVKITRSGVCHTDLHVWEGCYHLGEGETLQMADRGIHPPITPGHEITGQIVAAGPDAGEDHVGRVCVVHPWTGCDNCPTCARGDENLCLTASFKGIQQPGGYAEYVIVAHPKFCVDIGDLDPSQAAVLACSGVTTYGAIRKFGDILNEEPLVIIGAGGLGFMALSLVSAMGFKGAIMVDLDDAKLAVAKEAGALAVVNSSAKDAVAQITELTGGGALAVLDLVGAEASVNFALSVVARAAHVVICGLYGGRLSVPLPYFPMRPLHIQGSWVGNLQDLKDVVAIAQSGALTPVPVTERPLSEANDALMELRDGKTVGRSILVP
ncbi:MULTISPECIES: alcohol dehydrogenase [unclassified Ruegeria]|uniref:alcohol dehydrogenase n=1 Tax=unclassified Ruegeria TaxID=2625375 RepID=UPI001AD9A49D|nr:MULTISPECIES: alcohol dehydrogenase [unclassified Ruegeria]MBO9413559.1 alcohol dehydrogenase catalytic domain-containing protein [Ruegeria sp. R8_1]MBO9417258.1 alcohol dehydrogenase catalytic domain-containing protein [Ruegeria sp. R8_2]